MSEIQATVHYAGNDFFIGVSPGGHAQVMEKNRERAAAASPMDLLLVAVGGCMASDVVDILRKKREEVMDYRVVVRGERREDFPRSFKKIQLHHVVTGKNLSRPAVEQAIKLADAKYCSVSATLRPTAEVSVTFEIVQQVIECGEAPRTSIARS